MEVLRADVISHINKSINKYQKQSNVFKANSNNSYDNFLSDMHREISFCSFYSAASNDSLLTKSINEIIKAPIFRRQSNKDILDYLIGLQVRNMPLEEFGS